MALGDVSEGPTVPGALPLPALERSMGFDAFCFADLVPGHHGLYRED